MPEPKKQRRRLARLLAPLALLAVAAAILFVVSNSTVSNGDEDDDGRTNTGQSQTQTTGNPPERPGRRRYTIKAGDTLGAIAEKTGVSVETLQRLNPELDPQALVAGQRIRLRE